MFLRDGEVVGSESAAEVRAMLLREHRRHDARIAAGHDDPLSVEAEAGGILDAQTAIDIHRLRVIADAWLEANRG